MTDTVLAHQLINHNIPPSAPLFSYHTTSDWTPLTKTSFINRCNQVWSQHGFPNMPGHAFRIGGTTELLLEGINPACSGFSLSVLLHDSDPPCALKVRSSFVFSFSFLESSNHVAIHSSRIPADVTTLVSKEVNSAKLAMKRGFLSVVGAALWGLDAVSESVSDATKAFANLWRVGGMYQDDERESTRYDQVLWKATSPWPSRSVTWLFVASSVRLCLHFGCHGQSRIGQWIRS